jgi:peptidoglycan hydrolase-like protein with peptidoglycan-binding domain
VHLTRRLPIALFVTATLLAALAILRPSKSYAATIPTVATTSVICPNYVFNVGSSRGSCVLYIQEILNGECSIRAITHYPACQQLAKDNAYGGATAGQVRVFQTYVDVGVDGVVGHNTWVWLCDAAKSGTRNTNTLTMAEYSAGHLAGCGY